MPVWGWILIQLVWAIICIFVISPRVYRWAYKRELNR